MLPPQTHQQSAVFDGLSLRRCSLTLLSKASPTMEQIWVEMFAATRFTFCARRRKRHAHVQAPLDTMDALLCGIDAAVQDLDPRDNVAVVLAGDWEDVMLDLHTERAEGYEPSWRLDEWDSLVDVGQYHGCPIFRGPTSGERRVYVIDVGRWGRFVRASFEGGQDLRVDVQSISMERAEELLQANPDWFSEQPDHESKLRKVQTHVLR